jgi:hypothetical protein
MNCLASSLTARPFAGAPVRARASATRSAGRAAVVSVSARDAPYAPGTTAPAYLDGSLPGCVRRRERRCVLAATERVSDAGLPYLHQTANAVLPTRATRGAACSRARACGLHARRAGGDTAGEAMGKAAWASALEQQPKLYLAFPWRLRGR